MIVLCSTRIVGMFLRGFSDNWTRDDHKVMWLGPNNACCSVRGSHRSICASQFDWLLTLAITWSSGPVD